ncbi:MAG: IS4 family transposase [Oscillibacter sp.]|nr:IS4 family transposase [Oscillibacter sp.]
MNQADITKSKLNQAISEVAALRGSYSDDFRHFTRSRKLPLETLIKLILGMTGGTLARELHAAGVEIYPSSFVERRKQLSYDCFRDIMQYFNKSCDDPETLKGYRLFSVDGSTIPLPRNPKSENYYVSDANPKGWNNVHANLLFDILNQIFVDCHIGEGHKSHDEQGALYSLIYKRRFHQPTILLLDRGYESYNSITHLRNIPNLFFVLRVKQDRSALRPIRALPMEELDCNLEWTIITRQTNEAKQKGWIFLQTGSKKGKTNSPNTKITRWDFGHIDPYPMQCRVVRFKLDTGEFETLMTNLPQDEFSVSDLKELYAMRWKIETNIRFWKYAIGALAIHSRTDEFILQEVFAHLTMFNFCTRICRNITAEPKKNVKHERKINLTMGIYLCKRFFQTADADGEKLIEEIKKHTEPVRPNRADKRNLKVKTFSGFTYRIPS